MVKIVIHCKQKNLLPTELTNLLINAVLFISQYETDELDTFFDAIKKLIILSNTSVGFARGNGDADILKEPKMLEQLKPINVFLNGISNRYIL